LEIKAPSGFCGVKRVLQTEQEKQTVERARLIYAEIAAEDLAWAAAYAPLVAETLPAYESAKAEER
jgi:hypothetical protein